MTTRTIQKKSTLFDDVRWDDIDLDRFVHFLVQLSQRDCHFFSKILHFEQEFTQRFSRCSTETYGRRENRQILNAKMNKRDWLRNKQIDRYIDIQTEKELDWHMNNQNVWTSTRKSSIFWSFNQEKDQNIKIFVSWSSKISQCIMMMMMMMMMIVHIRTIQMVNLTLLSRQRRRKRRRKLAADEL